MTKDVQTLAIIPARGGSKSIPDKNIVELAGKPLIAHSIITALETPSINRVLVTTDSDKIREISVNYNAEAPFVRPASLAKDDTPDLPVFIHCLNWILEKEDYTPDLIVHLRPTTPFRNPIIIEACIQKLLADPNADSIRGITPSREHPYKMWADPGMSTYLEPIIKSSISEPYNQPRQELPKSYYQPGYVDVIRTSTITNLNSMTGKNILGHIINQENILDIDDFQSLLFARYLYDDNKPIT